MNTTSTTTTVSKIGCSLLLVFFAACKHGAARPAPATIAIPGFGLVTQKDICGDGPQCDVGGRTTVPLLAKNSSRRIVSDPYTFVGHAFRPGEQGGLNGPPFNCGVLDPGRVSTTAIAGDTKINVDRSTELKRTLAASLAKIFTTDVKTNVEAAIEKTFVGEISFERTIYTLKDDTATQRDVECSQAICKEGPRCKNVADYAVIYSASIIKLSGESVQKMKDKLVSEIKANANLNKVVNTTVGLENGLNDAVAQALTTSVTSFQFAAFVGFNDPLDAPAVPAI